MKKWSWYEYDKSIEYINESICVCGLKWPMVRKLCKNGNKIFNRFLITSLHKSGPSLEALTWSKADQWNVDFILLKKNRSGYFSSSNISQAGRLIELTWNFLASLINLSPWNFSNDPT